MSEKRKDAKGRVLRNGEVQRADGKYMFRYQDVNGERQTVYSWKLVETDKAPAGRRCDEALRTMEKRILKDLEDGIDSSRAGSITLNDLFDQFMQIRTKLKETTRCNYICLYDTHVREGFGRKKVGSIKYSDVYKFYVSLSESKQLKKSSIQSVNAILWQLFEMAKKDGYIRKNTADGVMRELSKDMDDESEKKHALTIAEQEAFVAYVYQEERYLRYASLFTVLLGTGMRIGEALGLTWSDINFSKGTISVNHSLRYKDTEKGGYEYHVSSPKTKAGNRTIPMFKNVKKALAAERKRQLADGTRAFEVDGYSGFVFTNSAGKVYTPAFIYDTLQSIVTDYNLDEREKARKEKREPLYLPKISAHILRHTFCTRMCENESNVKVIQAVMGHKNIRTTMDVYNEATAQATAASFRNLEGKIRLA